MADPGIGRLAMRVEGDNWNAYLAKPGTMEGAVLLGSIKLSAVKSNIELRQAFMIMMLGVVRDLCRDMTGETPTFGFDSVAEEWAFHG